jgi:hypothetical protein
MNILLPLLIKDPVESLIQFFRKLVKKVFSAAQEK